MAIAAIDLIKTKSGVKFLNTPFFVVDKLWLLGISIGFMFLISLIANVFGSSFSNHLNFFLTFYYFLPVFVGFACYKKVFMGQGRKLASCFLAAVLLLPLMMGHMTIHDGPHWATSAHFNSLNALFLGEISTDEVFHAALVNSIARVGYPSTGLNGDVLIPYHVFSHYYDAVFSKTFVPSFIDVYGQTVFTKTFSYVAAIILFSFVVVASRNFWLLAVHSALGITLLYWHGNAVGSHPLWLPSILLILSWPAFEKILRNPINRTTLLLFFIISILLSFGKISLGVCFAGVCGLILFFSNKRDYRIYVTGILLLGFILSFAFLIADPSDLVKSNISVKECLELYKPALIILFIVMIFSMIFRGGFCKFALPAMAFFLFIVIPLSWILVGESEMAWFAEGYRFLASIFLLSDLGKLSLGRDPLRFLDSKRSKFVGQCLNPGFQNFIARAFLVLCCLGICNGRGHGRPQIFMVLTAVSLLYFWLPFNVLGIEQFKIFNVYPFKSYNNVLLAAEEKTSLKIEMVKAFSRSKPQKNNQKQNELRLFREKLIEFVEKNQLHNIPLFFDRADWNVVYSFKNSLDNAIFDHPASWYYTIRLVAYLNIPMLNAIDADAPEYYWGFSHYNGEGLLTSGQVSPICKNHSSYIDVNFSETSPFQVISCTESKI
ncbi:hypothetical protein N9X39_03700 [Alphaproteobacteria bacterium]|nr:hypothetical protein [Alphaproteobacteria bacterium]